MRFGNFPQGSSPVAMFSGAPGMRGIPVNLSGVPAHKRAEYARRFNGMGDAPDDGYVPVTGDGSDGSVDGGNIDWNAILKGATPILDAAGKLLNPGTANTSLPAKQTNLTAAQVQAAMGPPKWLWPALLVGGAVVVGVAIFAFRK